VFQLLFPQTKEVISALQLSDDDTWVAMVTMKIAMVMVTGVVIILSTLKWRLLILLLCMVIILITTMVMSVAVDIAMATTYHATVAENRGVV